MANVTKCKTKLDVDADNRTIMYMVMNYVNISSDESSTESGAFVSDLNAR